MPTARLNCYGVGCVSFAVIRGDLHRQYMYIGVELMTVNDETSN